jgi:hypothetical protein
LVEPVNEQKERLLRESIQAVRAGSTGLNLVTSAVEKYNAAATLIFRNFPTSWYFNDWYTQLTQLLF